MMSMTASHPNKPRGQLKLLGIIAIVVGPIFIAWLMVKLQIGIPQTQSNQSSIVEPALAVTDWHLPLEPIGYGAPWRLLVTAPAGCDDACLKLVHEARQIHVATGREADRVEHVLALAAPLTQEQTERMQQDFPKLKQVPLPVHDYQRSLEARHADWQDGPQLWVIDPLGRVVLHRDADNPGKHLLDDLRRLLKLSKIG